MRSKVVKCVESVQIECTASEAPMTLPVAQLTSTACSPYYSQLRALFENSAREVLDIYLIS